MAHFETLLNSEQLFKGRVISLTRDTVQLENGSTATREVVHHNGGAGVIALNEKNEIYLVRQYRHALRRELLEIPAGKLEPGEDPLVAARRELAEEAGVCAHELLALGTVIPTCGYCSEVIWLYAAKKLTVTAACPDEDELLSVTTMLLPQAVQAVLSGEIADAKTVAAVLKLNALRTQGLF